MARGPYLGRRAARAAPLLALAAMLGCAAAPSPAAAPDPHDARPLMTLLDRAARRYESAVLGAEVHGTRYVFLAGDGRGRVTASAGSTVPPESGDLAAALRAALPGVDMEAWQRRVPEAVYPYGGITRFPPGTLAPDTVLVFWAERPLAVGSPPPAARGEFTFGVAAAWQMTPPAVRDAVRQARAGQTVWYVRDAGRRVLGVGAYAGGRDYEAIRAAAQPRFPGLRLTCTGGFSLPGTAGEPVLVVEIDAAPLDAAPATGGASIR
ncbi:MAG TPA: hypothetical protein VF541_10005 [Longimicrobium sp.]